MPRPGPTVEEAEFGIHAERKPCNNPDCRKPIPQFADYCSWACEVKDRDRVEREANSWREDKVD